MIYLRTINKNKRIASIWTKFEILNRSTIKTIQKKFECFIVIILKERYIMKNARRQRELREYASVILRAAKSTKLGSVTNQIAIIYNELDVKFQRNLIRSENITFLNAFLRKINDFKHIWWSFATRSKFNANQQSYNRYSANYNQQYSQFAKRSMNELTDNRNHRYENQYNQNQFTERYRESYNNSDNYNWKEKYAVYDFYRQFQSLYSNQFYQNNYSNRNQSQTYAFAFAFASQQDSSYQSENFYQYDKEKQNASSFNAQRLSQISSFTQSYLQRVFSKSSMSQNFDIKQKTYYASEKNEFWENEDQENVYSEQYFENDRKECHEDYV